MKRLSIILCFLLMGCSCEQECIDCLQAEIVVEDEIDSLLMENDSLIHEIFLQLDKTIDLEKNVKKTIRKKNILTKENKVLKIEIVETAKKMDSLKKEFEVLKSKKAGKQGFVKKLLHIPVDSIEVVDSVEINN
jgi:hypothetical protein